MGQTQVKATLLATAPAVIFYCFDAITRQIEEVRRAARIATPVQPMLFAKKAARSTGSQKIATAWINSMQALLVTIAHRGIPA